MTKRFILILIISATIAGCSSSPQKIEADEKLPTSPCACGPRVWPLAWGNA